MLQRWPATRGEQRSATTQRLTLLLSARFGYYNKSGGAHERLGCNGEPSAPELPVVQAVVRRAVQNSGLPAHRAATAGS
jgi:hypothetical protein